MTAYQALRPFKFAGRDYDRGDAVPRDAIRSVSAEKEGILLRTRFIGLPPEHNDLGRKTKAELIELGRTVGLKVDASWRKADLVEAVSRELAA